MRVTTPTTSSSLTAAEALFRKAEQNFHRARAASRRSEEMWITIAGLKVCIRGAGDWLLPKLGATLEHLKTGPLLDGDFTIHCWDEATTGCASPLTEQWAQYVDRYCCLNGMKGLTTERYRNFYMEWVGAFCAIDMETKTAYCCYRDAARISM